MATYQFKTTATMKPYNNKKWWIDSKIIPNITVEADSLRDALKIYQEIASEKHYISISNSAIKNKNPMFIDLKNGGSKQVGYVITGKTDFDKGDYSGYSTQYIDLWVTIHILQDAFGEV